MMFVKNFGNLEIQLKERLFGTVSHISGPVSYHVTLVDGHVIRRHMDHVWKFLHPVSVNDTIQLILEPDSQSDTGAITIS